MPKKIDWSQPVYEKVLGRDVEYLGSMEADDPKHYETDEYIPGPFRHIVKITNRGERSDGSKWLYQFVRFCDDYGEEERYEDCDKIKIRNVPVRGEIMLNVYPSSSGEGYCFTSQQDKKAADECALKDRVAFLHIKFEEGEGLED